MAEKLDKKVALVTGGSRGIGRAICLRFALKGIHVFVNYGSNADAAEETVALCTEQGGSAEALGFSVSDRKAVDEAIDTIRDRCGRLDILVNNAGISRDGLFVRMKDDDWEETLQVNLSGAFYCARAAAKVMMKARSGSIINVSSVVGQMGNVGQVPYVSSKAAIIGFTKALARELASRKITVNAVAPGFVETDMTAALDDRVKEEHLQAIPLGRYAQSAEVADLVYFLASGKAAYITGQVVGINGGMYM